MRPNWLGIIGWLCILNALAFALFVVPYPVNGLALVALASAMLGGLLVALAVRPSGGDL